MSVTWTRPPDWSVVNQSSYDERRRRRLYWVDVHMGPVQWRVVDWAGYEAALTLLRNVHRTAVAVCLSVRRQPSSEVCTGQTVKNVFATRWSLLTAVVRGAFARTASSKASIRATP
jgi:hypothetical protein